MRLNHIYITKEGEPMANPEMEYPTSPDKYGESPQSFPNQWDAYEHAIKKYHSGLLPFEDRDQVLREVTNKCKCIDVEHCKWAEKCYLSDKPDTLIPVDLEVEVVNVGGIFVRANVLRIKP